MTLQIAFLWVAELLMTGALFCFLNAFRLRKVDRARHMFWGKTGAYTVFTGLLAVEFTIRVLGWKFGLRSELMLHWHLGTAAAALVLLIALLITGVRRNRRVHTKLYILFLPLYTATVCLSWFAFQLW